MLTNDQIKKLYSKALAAQSAGKLNDAAKHYGRLLKSNPRIAEAQFNMARIHVARRDVAAAASCFEAALRLKPAEPAIWLAYLDMASMHPNISNLAKLIARTGTSLDRFPELAFYRGLVAARTGKPEARELFESALNKGLKSARALTELGILLAHDGETDAALRFYDDALALQADFDFALIRKSDLLRNLGRSDEALGAARAAIAAAPDVGAHYYSYASIRKVQPADPLIEQMKSVFRKTEKSNRSVGDIGHALAKAMEDTAQYDQVFKYLKKANDAISRAYPYDHAKDVDAFNETRRKFKDLMGLDVTAPSRDTTPTPIFVTGMPRSGTTLVEQILSSHSLCEGGGEMSIFSPLLSEAFQTAKADPKLLSDALNSAGEAYRAEIARRFPGARYVTDKSISSFASIGFIRHAMPDARIVVVRRDARDNALSIYKNQFGIGAHRYANDLKAIAQFYRLFEQQVAFWGEQAPDAFSQIRYEELIADPVDQSHLLVANAGLDWEDACLSFYKNKRRVDTLSTTQVRQPIYSSSVGAWKRYEAEMQPFLDEYAAEHSSG